MARKEFNDALQAFLSAGYKLLEAWDDNAGFNADEIFGSPTDMQGNPLLTHSLDEWLLEWSGYYAEHANT